MLKVSQSKISGKKIIKTAIRALLLFVVIAFGGFEDKAQVNKITVPIATPFMEEVVPDGNTTEKLQNGRISCNLKNSSNNTCPPRSKNAGFRRIKYVAPGWEFQEFIGDY